MKLVGAEGLEPSESMTRGLQPRPLPITVYTPMLEPYTRFQLALSVWRTDVLSTDTNTTYKNKINLILLCGQVYDWYPHFLLPESCYCLSNHFLQPCAARRTLSHSNPELCMSSESDIVNFNGSFTEIRTRIDNLMRIVWEPNP